MLNLVTRKKRLQYFYTRLNLYNFQEKRVLSFAVQNHLRAGEKNLTTVE